MLVPTSSSIPKSIVLTIFVAGQQIWPVAPGEDRTALDYNLYGQRTWWDDIGVFNCGYEWREAANQLVATFRTLFFPAIVWATLLQTVFGITMGASGQAVSFALLGAGFVNHRLTMQPTPPLTFRFPTAFPSSSPG